MKVYVEYVLIDNIVMDFILLYAALSISRVKFLKLRLLLAAFVGAVCAVFFPLINLKAALMLILKAMCGFVIVFIATDFKSFKQYIISTSLFFLFTFMLGGLLIAVFFMLKVDYQLNQNIYTSKFPIASALLAAAVLFFTAKWLCARLYRKKNIHSFIYKCRMTLGSKTIEVNGFLDSGNRLMYENFQPVYICGAKTVSNLFKEGLFINNTRAKYLDFQTISGKSKMLCFKIDKLEIYNGKLVNIINNIMLGISPFHIKGDEEYELILHPAAFKESGYAEKITKSP